MTSYPSLIVICSTLLGVSWAAPALANGNCPASTGGPALVTMTVNHSLAPDENVIGATFEGPTIPTIPTLMGPCQTTATSIDSPSTLLNEVYSAGALLPSAGDSWLQFSDELDIQLYIGSSAYDPSGGDWLVPFMSRSGVGKVAAGEATSHPIPPSYGDSGRIMFRMRQAVVGQVVLPMTDIAILHACVSDDGSCAPAGAPIYRYSLGGTLTMPASCSINAGETITVDFGEMSTEDFAIPGQVALDAMRPIRVPIQCNGGVQGTANLELSFAATPASQDERLIATSNPDLGIALGASSQLGNSSEWIAPNTGSMSLQLDGSGAAEAVLYATPARAGNQPQAGAFSGVATLKIAIP